MQNIVFPSGAYCTIGRAAIRPYALSHLDDMSWRQEMEAKVDDLLGQLALLDTLTATKIKQ